MGARLNERQPDVLLGSRICVVDDDPSNRELVQARLEYAGFTNLVTAANGLEAVERFKQEAPDILLLDVMMPGMNGFEVIEFVRATYPEQFIPIILLSAMGNVEDRVRGIEAGANDFLNKPYDAEELIVRVRSLLAYKQAVDHLNAERARMSALLSQIGNPVIVTDPAGVVTQANPAAEDALAEDEPLGGRSLKELFGPDLEDLLLRARERGVTISGVYQPRRSSKGQALTFNVSVSPIEGIGYILVWQDITELEEAQRVRLDNERAQTKHVLDTFSRYMSPALVERVLQVKNILNRHEQREATVLFADLRGFTQLTVRQSPDKVMGLLNEIYNDMLDIVTAHEGLVFDIVGDELMVAFNVPYPQDNAFERALDTAVAIQRQFNQHRIIREDRDMQVGLGIGIYRGPVVLGHIGGRSHKSYTMIGDTVNIAHRMVEQAEDRQIITDAELIRDWSPPDGDITITEMSPNLLRGIPDLIALAVINVVK